VVRQAMAQKDGVESDLADPNPSIYAGKRVVVRIKHSPPSYFFILYVGYLSISFSPLYWGNASVAGQ
jgi:hypothetical protein